MNKFTTLLLASVCASSVLVGCIGKDGDPGPAGTNGTNGTNGNPGPQGPAGPAGPSGQNLTGTLFGFVNPLDEAGNPVAKSGVTISLEGVTPAITVTTDANGRFEFPGLRNGTYNLSYSRTDLGSYRRIGVGHVGGDQPTFAFTTAMSQPSTTRVSAISAVPNSANGSVSLQLTLANTVLPTGSFLRYVVYVGASPTVTSSTGLQYANTIYGGTAPIGSTTANATTILTRAGLNSLGFATGTPVYVTVYGISNNFAPYADPATGRNVYTSLSTTPSTVTAFLVP